MIFKNPTHHEVKNLLNYANTAPKSFLSPLHLGRIIILITFYVIDVGEAGGRLDLGLTVVSPLRRLLMGKKSSPISSPKFLKRLTRDWL